jgi:hypothetical protein
MRNQVVVDDHVYPIYWTDRQSQKLVHPELQLSDSMKRPSPEKETSFFYQWSPSHGLVADATCVQSTAYYMYNLILLSISMASALHPVG